MAHDDKNCAGTGHPPHDAPHNAPHDTPHDAHHPPAAAGCCGGGCHADPGDEQCDDGPCDEGGAYAAAAAACGATAAKDTGDKPTAWKTGWGDDPGDESPHGGGGADDLWKEPPRPAVNHHGPGAEVFRAIPACGRGFAKPDPGPAPSLPILAILYDVPEFAEPPPQLAVTPLQPLPAGPDGDPPEAEGADPGWLERWQDAVKFNNGVREANDAAAAAYRKALTDYHIRRDESLRETQWARDQNRQLAALNRDRIAAYNAALSVWLAAGGCLEDSHGWLTLPHADADPATDVVKLEETPQVA